MPRPGRCPPAYLRVKTTTDSHISPDDLTSPVVLGELLVCADPVPSTRTLPRKAEARCLSNGALDARALSNIGNAELAVDGDLNTPWVPDPIAQAFPTSARLDLLGSREDFCRCICTGIIFG